MLIAGPRQLFIVKNRVKHCVNITLNPGGKKKKKKLVWQSFMCFKNKMFSSLKLSHTNNDCGLGTIVQKNLRHLQ